MGTELAESKAGVPDLVRPRDASRTITVEDIKFPRLYIGQSISTAVESGLVETGDLFVAQDKDDPDPQVLAEKGSTEGVLFHVLDLRKGKSRSIDGVLETWKYDDPNVPSDAWTTYTYFIAVPAYADDLALRLLLTRTGRSAAQKINTVLLRQQGDRPPYELAFRLTTDSRQNAKGKFFIPLITPVEPTEESLAVAAKLAGLVEQNQGKVETAANEGPAI